VLEDAAGRDSDAASVSPGIEAIATTSSDPANAAVRVMGTEKRV
jgi:hypothetical protein